MHDNTVDLLRTVGMVMAASLLGLPVSSTHILIGAVLGVGIVNRAANWGAYETDCSGAGHYVACIGRHCRHHRFCPPRVLF
ncbi:hypothetical protein HMPREF3148_09215 [Corynebacterium sp. HMSC05D08]|nr:hypothetical protein HMPREF3148_09215 [Corynebacterium sp. HMSC05D08]CQD14772.1 hypothetical protein U2A404260064 [Corynebacterium striatum]